MNSHITITFWRRHILQQLKMTETVATASSHGGKQSNVLQYVHTRVWADFFLIEAVFLADWSVLLCSQTLLLSILFDPVMILFPSNRLLQRWDLQLQWIHQRSAHTRAHFHQLHSFQNVPRKTSVCTRNV